MRRQSVLARLVRPSRTACWTWTGARRGGRGGQHYGAVRVAGVLTYVHRFMYEVSRGRTIPVNREVDHVCENPLCANPDHLRLTARATNARRGQAKARRAP